MTTTVETHPETRGTTATSISNLIGHTPLVRMDHLFDGLPFEVYGKLEKLNPGGSIKDRAAQSMIERAIRRGEIVRAVRPSSSPVREISASPWRCCARSTA